ncbi:MAG: hypothetical protein RI956_707 [Pseudomonadota bacterium]
MPTPLWHIRQTSPYWTSASGLGQLAWEQKILNTFSENVFGYYAVTLELNALNLLEYSSIPHILRMDSVSQEKVYRSLSTNSKNPVNILVDLHNWPFDDDSLDYIILPHVLEFSDNPHSILREAQRCLRAGGYLSITAFNPHSFLGIQAGHIELGHRHQWLTRRRLLDWMQLLNLYPDRGAFGQWRPMTERPKLFNRLAWLDKAGERWWPHGANIFALRVVKRVVTDTRQVVVRQPSILDHLLNPTVITAADSDIPK